MKTVCVQKIYKTTNKARINQTLAFVTGQPSSVFLRDH